ncbi:MAG: translation initiation factor IF-2 N-terminal domain-containing protein, partial [Chloroflexi bacterium]|nr:translation initiation factor IF-2 N-terminal domain-containing protein [Chloroflexota bacterium]
MARELGVSSTAIMKKCQDEGLDIKNHMATISAGLAATIKEWFSEGDNTTAVETADKVDLEKVRVKKSRSKKSAEAAPPPAETPQETPAVTRIQETPPIATPVVETPAEPIPAVEEPAPPQLRRAVARVEPPKPELIIPAGPMLGKPEPAKLTGPQVVRIEKPEPMAPLRRPRPKPRHDMPVTSPLMASRVMPSNRDKDAAAAKDKDGQLAAKKTKERTHGRRRTGTEYETETVKKTKLITQRRERDLEERRARLDAASSEGLRLRPLRRVTARTRQDGGAVSIVKPASATITEPVTVKGLATALAVKVSDVIAKLMRQNLIATANQTISTEVAELVSLELGTELHVEHRASLEDQIKTEFENRPRNNVKRRPVVATMLG